MPTEPYDRDKPSTYEIPRKCKCCGWWFDFAREGMDYPDEIVERVTLCGDCAAESDEDAMRFLNELLSKGGA